MNDFRHTIYIKAVPNKKQLVFFLKNSLKNRGASGLKLKAPPKKKYELGDFFAASCYCFEG
jgi:hypothetical protein